MRQKNWMRPVLETLEDRLTPSSYNITGSGTTLTVTQVAGVSAGTTALTISDDGAGTITLADTGGTDTVTLTTTGFPNLSISLINTDVVPVNYNLTGARGGNVTLNIGNTAARTLNLNTTGTIGGNLSVTGGTGAFTVTEVAGISVGGNATFTGGLATDVLNLAVAPGTVGGNVTLNKFNTVSFDTDTIGGSLFFNDASEFTANTLTMTGTVVGSNINYTGGSSSDAITLAGAAVVGGNAYVSFGSQGPAATSSLSMNGTTVVGGSLTLIGGNLGNETVTLAATATLAGNANINFGASLPGAVTNTVNFLGVFGGSSFNYTGGAGVDALTYQVAAGSTRARFTATLGAGNDTVAFAAAPGTSNPSYAYIDFGAGADSVTGLINFPFTFLNLP